MNLIKIIEICLVLKSKYDVEYKHNFEKNITQISVLYSKN